MPDKKKKDEEQDEKPDNPTVPSPTVDEAPPNRTDTNDMSLVEPDEDEIDMDAKLNDLGGGIHPTSATFGMVYSDYETDGDGKGPEEFSHMGIADPDEVDAPELNSPASKKPKKAAAKS